MAFGLEVRRWVESGPRLAIRYMAPAITAGGIGEDPNKYIHLTVSNNGSQATTVTHYLLYGYKNWWAYLLRKRERNLIVPNPQLASAQLPYVLEPGKEWSGSAILGDKLKDELDECSIWTLGVAYSYSRRPKMKRLRIKPSPPNEDAVEAPND